MSSTSDALNALREAIAGKRDIGYSNDSGPCSDLNAATTIVLSPSLSLPKDTPTRVRKPNNPTAKDPKTEPSLFYRLDAVLLAWLLRDASASEYMMRAREARILGSNVSTMDRRDLVDWLMGKKSSHKDIIALASESTTPPGTPPAQNAILPGSGAQGVGTSSATVKRKYVVDQADAEVVKKIKANEVELSDRNSILRGSKLNDFTNVRTIFSDRLKKMKEASKPGAIPPSAAGAKIDPKNLARKARHMSPIIIISSSPTSLVTMYNVRKFLQESVFEDPSEARSRANAEGNTRPEDVIPIYRTHTHIDPSGQERKTQARYYVVDGVDALAKFGADAWDRVVCVLTTGQAWQFKPYKWSEPKTLFHHVKGFYVSWANDPQNVKIKDWNVTELKIDQHRRHIDKSVVASFWKSLDAWTLSNKPWLMKS
ncbi:RNA polymerase II-associated [Pyrrhoderma noxium]|uniref:RNA polymerase II-associated n=1 Tax=Pyrrhoderma noxium TaxID=2282107 RepID=A0A286UUX5_9AGAM|nr:RNA polymerase II-associated [Pyrrhoderma noxium]